MVRIYHGKKYDTETAQAVFRLEDTTLYKTRDSLFFLFMRGKYGAEDRDGGAEIKPLSASAAAAWAAGRMPEALHGIVFGYIKDGKASSSVRFRVTDAEKERITAAAARCGMSESDFIRGAMAYAYKQIGEA